MKRFSFDKTQARKSAAEADIWNVFVQIFMPLVIVLSFVAILEIARFKQGFDERGWMIKVFQDEKDQRGGSPTNQDKGRQRQIIDLQLQKLMLALDVVMAAKREALGFGRIPDATAITVEAPRVRDEAFKALCRNVRAIGNLKVVERQVFGEVLAKAGLKDVAQYDPRPSDQRDQFIAPHLITLENRNHVTARIAERVGSLHDELQRIQQKVLARIFDGLLLRPEALDPTTRALSQKVTDPKVSAPDQADAARALVRHLNERIKHALAQDGYEFLDKTWESINL